MMIHSNVSFQPGVILQNPFGKYSGINENVPSLYSFEIDLIPKDLPNGFCEITPCWKDTFESIIIILTLS